LHFQVSVGGLGAVIFFARQKFIKKFLWLTDGYFSSQDCFNDSFASGISFASIFHLTLTKSIKIITLRFVKNILATLEKLIASFYYCLLN
jgi:hypothetical protein